TEAFIRLLQELPEQRHAAVCNFFNPQRALVVSRAPGRLDLMGGIADYSGSLVLEFPIAAAAHVALQLDHEPKVSVVSLGPEAPRTFAMALSDCLANGQSISYEAAHARFRAADNWPAYVVGAFLVLMRERNVVFDQGARILISSNVPEGKGVSSSAALE